MDEVRGTDSGVRYCGEITVKLKRPGSYELLNQALFFHSSHLIFIF